MINLFAVSPSIQAVFDAMTAVLAEDPTRVNVNSSASNDTGGSNVSISITDKYMSTAQYSLRITTGRVFLEPMTGSLGPGATLQFTATTVDTSGEAIPATVTWVLQAGATGSVSPTGLYTAPAAIASASTDFITATDAANASATASIGLHP